MVNDSDKCIKVPMIAVIASTATEMVILIAGVMNEAAIAAVAVV